MHLKKKRSIKLSNKIIIVIILLIISIIYIFKIFNEKALPIFLSYSEEETKKIATLVINNAISKHVTTNLTVDNLFITNKDSNGNITSIDLNPTTVNKVLSTTTNTVEMNLKYLQEGKIEMLEIPDGLLVSYDESNLKKGIIYELPSGIIFNNSLLTNIFSKIPIKLSLVGSIVSNLNTKVESYGINNALIQVYIDLEVQLKVLLPFTSKNTKVKISMPVAFKIIEGKIPSYYMNGYLPNPYISNNIE